MVGGVRKHSKGELIVGEGGGLHQVGVRNFFEKFLVVNFQVYLTVILKIYYILAGIFQIFFDR